MSVIYLMIPMAMIIGTGFVFAFVWAVNSGQLDDTDTPQARALIDDEEDLQGDKKV
jgi:cbb3-type cytochrome oxidase maturation protein